MILAFLMWRKRKLGGALRAPLAYACVRLKGFAMSGIGLPPVAVLGKVAAFLELTAAAYAPGDLCFDIADSGVVPLFDPNSPRVTFSWSMAYMAPTSYVTLLPDGTVTELCDGNVSNWPSWVAYISAALENMLY